MTNKNTLREVNFRPFERKDLTETNELIDLLGQLTKVGVLSNEMRAELAEYFANNEKEFIIVAEIEGRIVGTAKIFMERKIAHSGGYVGHIEDVVVHKDYRGYGIGGNLLTDLYDQAKKFKAYKAILDCSEKNVPFYEKNLLHRSEICMRRDFPQFDI